MNFRIEDWFNQSKMTYYILHALMIGAVIGFFIVQNNQFLLFFAFFLSIRLLIFTRPNTSVYLILISVFFIDWMRDMNLISSQFTLLPDVILMVLTMKVIWLKFRDKKIFRTPVDVPILLYIFLGMISTLINAQHPITTFVGFRFDLKYVFMFYLIVQLNPDIRFYKRLFVFLVILLLIQVPVAIGKYFVYGQGEQAIGTYAYQTGILSTVIPLIAISLFVGLYFFHKNSGWYILGCLLFFLFSIIGGKRGFLFFAFGLTLFLGWQVGLKNLAKIYTIAPFFIIGFLGTIYLVPDLRPAIQDPLHLINWSVSYETMHSKDDGAAAGRTAAFMKTNELLLKQTSALLVGYGPGSISQSFFQKYKGRLEDKIPIVYGRSQWVTMSLEEGYIGVLLFIWSFVSFFKVAHRVFERVDDPLLKAIAFGFKGIIFTFLICMNYGVIFRMDVSGFIFWFLAAFVFSVGKQKQIL